MGRVSLVVFSAIPKEKKKWNAMVGVSAIPFV